MQYTREQIEAYQKELKEYAKNKYPHRRLNYSIGEEFLEHKFPKKLPEEALLVSNLGSLIYKLSDGKAYGFSLGRQSCYLFDRGWDFSIDDYWRKATKQEETKFIEMIKKECEKHLLFENTKIEKHADGTSLVYPNCTGITPRFNSTHGYNRNGLIFYRGKFATPRKEEGPTTTQVSKAVKEIGDFIVERTESGVIILTPKNK